MQRILRSGTVLLAILAGTAGMAHAQPSQAAKKLGPALNFVYKQNAAPQAQARSLARSAAPSKPSLQVAITTPDGFVKLDAIAASDTAALVSSLEALGARDVSSYGRVVSAAVPIDKLGDLGASAALKFARPAFAATHAGLVTTQGDRSMRTDTVRKKTGLDGSGLTVGILSDSFGCVSTPLLPGNPITTVSEDIANGDLPPQVTILSDITSDCTDEGRAMGQLVHDVAPGASIAFYTAFNGEADFANGILALAKSGADVIVDDVIYYTEPMFQDGIIAQAADEAARLGVPYFSSNGNNAREAYQSDFRPVSASPGGLTGTWHDFDPGPGVDVTQSLVLTPADGLNQTSMSFQWDEPFFSVSGPPGSASDVDVVMFDDAGNPVPDCFVFLDENGYFPNLCQFFFTDGGQDLNGGVGGDALDLVSLVSFEPGPVTVQIGFEVKAGPAPHLVKYAPFVQSGSYSVAEWDTQSGSAYGHSNAAGAEGVGAAAFFLTEEFGDLAQQLFGTQCSPACLNDFSSAGGTPIVFTPDGRRLWKPDVRLKPGITGPDGGNTSFFYNDTSRDDDDGDGVFQTGEPGEFPNFYGTSAAAPHVAAVAALLIDAEKSGIKTVRRGQTFFRMCKPRGHGYRPGIFVSLRKFGQDINVRPQDVDKEIAKGALLRPCDATEPADLYDVMRDTAQDMHVRASLDDASVIQTFDEYVVWGAKGFDFDSGYGFIDGVAAVKKFQRDHGYGGYYSHGYDDHDKWGWW